MTIKLPVSRGLKTLLDADSQPVVLFNSQYGLSTDQLSEVVRLVNLSSTLIESLKAERSCWLQLAELTSLPLDIRKAAFIRVLDIDGLGFELEINFFTPSQTPGS